MTEALILLLALLSAVLILRAWKMRRQLQRVRDILDEVRGGNLNRRFTIQTSDGAVQGLAGDLNAMIEQFQKTVGRAEYLEESRKKMISNISHDLRTPLTSLLGYVEALQQDLSLIEDERSRYLGIIASKGNHLSHLFQEFFELAKLESDDALLKVQRVNLTERVEEVLITFYQAVVNAGLTPEITLPERPLYVWGDPVFIERILNNLLSNALRYGKDGGVIGIELRAEQERVYVEIWDKGKGIEANDLPFIFERLYTGASSRNKQLQGNGLGLTITKQLVEKQQGQITVSSEPHVKTVFTFWLPQSV